jgi:hypothetical protein
MSTFLINDIVVCNEDNHKKLTLKKRYKIVGLRNQYSFYIIDDKGMIDWYSQGLFFNVSESIRVLFKSAQILKMFNDIL